MTTFLKFLLEFDMIRCLKGCSFVGLVLMNLFRFVSLAYRSKPTTMDPANILFYFMR